MASIRKQDKVRLRNGMIGTITEIQGDEVVVRGEDAGTRLRFVKSAVEQVVRESRDRDEAEAEAEAKSE